MCNTFFCTGSGSEGPGTRLKLPLQLAGAILATAANACGDPPSPGGDSSALEAIVRDSAGVRIVENPRPPSASRLDWRIGTEPAVSIGAREGEGPYLLHRARDALTLADGRIVVANTGSDELRVFDASGIHVATWGRRGEGPGEFVALTQVHRWRGDSLLALYSRARHLSVLDYEGNVGRAFTLLRGESFFRVEAVLPAGALLSSDLVPRVNPSGGLSRTEETYRVRDAEGDMLSLLGSFPGTEWFSSWSGSSGWSVEIPHAHRISTFPWGDLVAIAPNDTYEIRGFALDGTLKRIVRRDHGLVASTEAHIDAEIEDRVARRPEEERAERRRELREDFQEIPLPETFPAFAEATADLVGHLWVREHELPGEGSADPVWTVFDPEGRILGFVETPGGLDIYEIGEDYILGLATDEVGVEYIQVWSLERSGQ